MGDFPVGRSMVVVLALCICALGGSGCSDDDPGAPITGAWIMSDVSGPYCSIDNATCQATIDIPFHVAGGNSAAGYTFEIHLDLQSDGTIDEELVVQDVLSGAYPDYVIGYTLPLGRHVVSVGMRDGAGDTYSRDIAVEVVDCRAPAPICINGLAVTLQPLNPPADADGDGDLDTAASELAALDFVASPITDCSMPIRYSINRVGNTPNLGLTSIVLTDDDNGTVLVEVHAWDSASNPLAPQPGGTTGGPNHDYCETYILVQ